MPWKTDQSGEKVYRPSIYAKEELPTWGEMYDDFFKGQMHTYDPSNESHQEMDPYWKIPRRKVIIATACNQFNKMLFEDGKLKDALQYISDNIMEGAIDIRFTCELVEPWQYDEIVRGGPRDLTRLHEAYLENWSSMMSDACVGSKDPPPIYTIALPNGQVNPFILQSSRVKRRDVFLMQDQVLCLHPIILFNNPPLKSTDSKIYTPRPFDPLQLDDWNKVIEFMMKDIATYFEGEGVGWKDANGHLIETDPLKRPCSSGYDPAL